MSDIIAKLVDIGVRKASAVDELVNAQHNCAVCYQFAYIREICTMLYAYNVFSLDLNLYKHITSHITNIGIWCAYPYTKLAHNLNYSESIYGILIVFKKSANTIHWIPIICEWGYVLGRICRFNNSPHTCIILWISFHHSSVF